MRLNTVAWWARVATEAVPHVKARILAAPPAQRLELAEIYLAAGLQCEPHFAQMTELIDRLESTAPEAKPARRARGRGRQPATLPASPSLNPLMDAIRDCLRTSWAKRIFSLVGCYREEAEAEAQRFLAARAAILQQEPAPVSLLEAQVFVAGVLAVVNADG